MPLEQKPAGGVVPLAGRRADWVSRPSTLTRVDREPSKEIER